MELKIREHIERLFTKAPTTAQANELKEEIIRNTIDRYHDALSEGKTEEEAYSLAIAGIGDINELFAELGGELPKEPTYDAGQLAAAKERSRLFKAIAVGLYILCVTPVILFSETAIMDNLAPALMFFMISAAMGLLVYGGKTKYLALEQNPAAASKIRQGAIMKAVAIGLFISCVTPPIILDGTVLESISPVFLFAMIAAGVVLLIFSKSPKATVDKRNVSRAAAEVPKKRKNPVYYALVAALWVAASMAYIMITVFYLPTVVFSWIIFPLAAALQGLMRAIFDYLEVK